MTVKIGDRAVYLPRVPYGRQSELFCFVSRVVDADRGIVDIITFPADGELQRINNVMPKGDGVHVHCWVPREDDARIAELEARVAHLEGATGALHGNVERTPEQIADEAFLEGSQWTPEQQEIIKRKPGRPRKDAA